MECNYVAVILYSMCPCLWNGGIVSFHLRVCFVNNHKQRDNWYPIAYTSVILVHVNTVCELLGENNVRISPMMCRKCQPLCLLISFGDLIIAVVYRLHSLS